MARPFQFETGEYYHVFNRGVEKRTVFMGSNDKERFLKLLYLCNATNNLWLSALQLLVNTQNIFQRDRGPSLIDIGCYCLMDSHFHLLLREKQENGISAFMQKLATAYTMYFNVRNERTGSLFEGRFRARHIDTDEYLKYMFSYIHLNPIQQIEPKWKDGGIGDMKKVKNYLDQYRYSSLYEYKKFKRPESAILTRSAFPSYFETGQSLEEEMNSWMEFTPTIPLQY